MPAQADEPRGPRRLLVGAIVAVAVIAFVALHVAGVFGPGGH